MATVQSVGLPQEETEQEKVIRGMSVSLIQRMSVMVSAGVNTGDISVALNVSSSVIAMLQSDPERFASIRGDGTDPRDLGGGGKVGAGPTEDGEGRSYTPGVIPNF